MAQVLEGRNYQIERIFVPNVRLYHVSNLLTLDECDQLIKYIDEYNKDIILKLIKKFNFI